MAIIRRNGMKNNNNKWRHQRWRCENVMKIMAYDNGSVITIDQRNALTKKMQRNNGSAGGEKYRKKWRKMIMAEK
jgi:acetyl-CoA carboxylase alpha subunit